jgi:hypothetical protein
MKLFFILYLFSICILSCTKNSSPTSLSSINDANKNTGASAKDLLTSSQFSSLKIEIEYMQGYTLDVASLNNITSFLNSLINKPGGIIITQKQIAAEGKPVYSLNDIATIEQKNRSVFNSGNQLAVYILIVDGNYTDANVLGVSYRNTSVCLFGKTIFDNSGNIGEVNRTKLETTVAEHEFGHLLGLVNLGTAMQTNHQDAAHGNHCNNENCLMYYAAETTDLLGFLMTGNVPQLDAACLADLHAAGGK